MTRYLSVATLVFAVLIAFGLQSFVAGPAPATAHTIPDDTLSTKDILLFVSGFLSALVAIVALFVSIRNTNTQVKSSELNANAQRWRDANQKEIEQLEELLRMFHVPLLVRSEANHNMAQDLRDRLNDPTYRMLLKLFDPNWLTSLSEGDRTIVGEVCRTGLELRKFIEDFGGRADAKLAEHLARASTHFRILFLAYDGKLGSDPSPFQRYVYPRQLDAALEADRKRILQRIEQLRAKPSENHGIIEPLRLPADAQLESWPNPVRFDLNAQSPNS